jgi:U2 small nuclear ribonucleoprotein B''
MAETVQATPSSSRHQATVEDEPENGGDVEMKPAEAPVVPKIKKIVQQQEEEEEDDGTIPENATETLYLQNLNEKVQVKGEHLEPLRDLD